MRLRSSDNGLPSGSCLSRWIVAPCGSLQLFCVLFGCPHFFGCPFVGWPIVWTRSLDAPFWDVWAGAGSRRDHAAALGLLTGSPFCRVHFLETCRGICDIRRGDFCSWCPFGDASTQTLLHMSWFALQAFAAAFAFRAGAGAPGAGSQPANPGLDVAQI